MIGQLTGLVGQIEGERCIVDVNGVGYVVSASTRTLAALPQPPSVARVLIETIVREDAIQLFGFATTDERDWFRLLTTVQGVWGRKWRWRSCRRTVRARSCWPSMPGTRAR